ncbi:MAG: GTPase [Candidatus Aenigmatarchaeota archaeon]
MPINAGVEYFIAESDYRDAKTTDEKIAALEKMIKLAPKHKGAHTLLAQLKKKLSALRKDAAKAKAAASKRPKFSIRKEGAAQVCVVGLTNSGKSLLLKTLTNAAVKVGEYPYTTKTPAVGMMDYEGVKIQLVEIPATFDAESMSIVRTCDLIMLLLDATKELDGQLNELTSLLERHGLQEKALIIVENKSDEQTPRYGIAVSAKTGDGLQNMKEEIWKRLHLIRIYTKSPNGKAATRPLTLAAGSTVDQAVRQVHKTMLRGFRFARVFDDTRFSGKKVGLEYLLKDRDVLEIHAG